VFWIWQGFVMLMFYVTKGRTIGILQVGEIRLFAMMEADDEFSYTFCSFFIDIDPWILVCLVDVIDFEK
jgi:hypothetical protein